MGSGSDGEGEGEEGESPESVLSLLAFAKEFLVETDADDDGGEGVPRRGADRRRQLRKPVTPCFIKQGGAKHSPPKKKYKRMQNVFFRDLVPNKYIF